MPLCYISMAMYLIDHGANPNSKNSVGDPVIFASIGSPNNNALEVVKLLVESGADIKAVDKFGRTILHEAAHSGEKDVVEFCLKKGIPVDIKDNIGRTPLYDATYRGGIFGAQAQTEIAELLIANGSRASISDAYGITPLHEAARYSSNNLISLLLKNNAELDAKDNQGITPLLMAVYGGNNDGFQLLIQKGASLQHKTKNGATALHFVSTPEIAAFILKNNININARDNNGLTPLHYAVECTCIDQYTHLYTRKGKDYRIKVDAIRFLIANGADVNARDNNGVQPLDCTEEEDGDSVYTSILKEYGAKRSSAQYKKTCAD